MLTEAILVGLAGWRVAHLLVYEDGPFDIFLKLRDKIIGTGPIEGFFPKLFSCIWCMSIWTTLISYGVFRLEPIMILILAGAAVAVLAQEFTEKHG